MNAVFRSFVAMAGLAIATHAVAQVTFYEREGFEGRSFSTERRVEHLDRYGFNDRASSVVVTRDRWEVCDGARFTGRCVVLRPGKYPSLAAMGLNDRVSSVRDVKKNARVEDWRYAPAPMAAQISFYERERFEGRTFSAEEQVVNFRRSGFNDRASSVVVLRDRWEVCDGARFTGRCVVLRPGNYPSLAAMGLNDRVSSVRAVQTGARIDDRRYAPAPLAAQITFYERERFEGRAYSSEEQVDNFQHSGFNDRASSAVVLGDRWEVCEDAQFKGRCIVLRPGRYPSLAAMGLNDRVSSFREVSANARIDESRYAPAPAAAYDYRRRQNERLYEVPVNSVRAVIGTPEQRCWVEQEQVAQERGNASVPAAIAGALIGGILGHQIGGGSGKDIATVGGAVAGAAVGANLGRDSGGLRTQTRDVQRCENVPGQARAEYWEVTYEFRGQEHRVQMADRPGRTISVNEKGEPRA
ncbi:MAG: glycine zipper 2TM domain-containing protein [Burkholderiaceae bacterium]|nr:glycine zipper 2TM domain-containing protein [Burkholderiaceae bacterium]